MSLAQEMLPRLPSEHQGRYGPCMKSIGRHEAYAMNGRVQTEGTVLHMSLLFTMLAHAPPSTHPRGAKFVVADPAAVPDAIVAAKAAGASQIVFVSSSRAAPVTSQAAPKPEGTGFSLAAFLPPPQVT